MGFKAVADISLMVVRAAVDMVAAVVMTAPESAVVEMMAARPAGADWTALPAIAVMKAPVVTVFPWRVQKACNFSTARVRRFWAASSLAPRAAPTSRRL